MSATEGFIALRLCVLTVSDTRRREDDTSGDYLQSALLDAGHQLADRALLPDDRYRLGAAVSAWIADDGVDGVLVGKVRRDGAILHVTASLTIGVRSITVAMNK